jgi:protein O-GlcNAc transferase
VGFFIMKNPYIKKKIIPNDNLLKKGLQLHQEGQYEKAKELYLEIIKVNKFNYDALHLLGIIYLQNKEYQISLNFIKAAIKMQPNAAAFYSNQGNALKGLNLLDEAIESYNLAISKDPKLSDAYYNLAIIQFNLNQIEKCIVNIKKAIELNPNMVDAYITYANALHNKKDYINAIFYIDIAIIKNPIYAKAYINKGNALERLFKYEEALLSYEKALLIEPINSEIHVNIGVIYSLLENNNEAKKYYKKALELNSNNALAFINIGALFQKENKLKLAVRFYKKSLELKPNNSIVNSNLASILSKLGKYEEAVAQFEYAIKLDKDNADLYSNLGVLLHQMGRQVESKANHDIALSISPESLIYLWERAMCEIAASYVKDYSSSESIINFEKRLKIIEEIVEARQEIYNSENIVGKNQPYHIAYLNTNNVEILKKYGKLCVDIMGKSAPNILNKSFIKELKKDEKIKIGIISSHIRYHSIWNAFLKGIVSQIDKKRFDLYIYYLEGTQDDQTNIASECAKKFIIGQYSLKKWADLISNDNLDIILYPEIGMNKLTTQLACLRLANMQCTSWGHPETSGLPTIDYYISAELTEKTNSQENYSEKLLKLNNLGSYFEPPSLDLTEYDFINNGLNTESKLFLCLGYSNKYHPDNDDILISLAKRFPDYQFVFIQDVWGNYKILQNRLHEKFAVENLDNSNTLKFIPYPSREGFNTLMSNSRLLLDTVYFSHFNTSMQALGNTLPVVTIEGQFMRSRATSGMLKMIHLDELIVVDKISFINLITRLTEDNDYYEFIKEKIKGNVQLLYKDLSPIRSLENFFIDKVNR